MQLSDLTVAVRDKSLRLIGIIPNDDLVMDAAPLHNAVGVWKVTLPSEHPMCAPLMEPGAGIVISDDIDVLISGPTIKVELAVTPDDQVGTVTFEGVGDEVILSDRLAFPQPTNPNPATQNVEKDTRSGVAETLMHGFVNANVGPSAPTGRKSPYLVMGENLARGAATSKSARFATLQEVVLELATAASLGYRVVQRGTEVLSFETYEILDRRNSYPLSLRNNTLSGYRVVTTPPALTRAIVAGAGEGVTRTILDASSTASVQAETNWGRRIERFVDASGAGDATELQQAASEALAIDGLSGLGIQAVPTEDTWLKYGRDWFLGDMLSVEVNGLPVIATVTGYVLKVDDTGVRTGMVLGEGFLLNPNAAVTKKLSQVGSRTSSLERT